MEHECWLYVNKQGPSSRQWKKRWVGWNENNQSLEYRKQPGDRSATAIGIGKVDSISASSVCHHRKTDTLHPSTGFIVAADRVYYFSSETLDDREKWIEFLWRKRNVYISLGSTDSQQRPSNLSLNLTGSGHDYPTQSLEQSNAGHVLANLPPLMPVLLNEAMATQAPKIQITPRSEGEAAPLSPHISHRQAMDDESKRASWSPMSSHEIDQLKKEKDQLEIDLKSLRDKFDTVSEKYRLETKRLGVPQYGTERRKNTSESAPNTLKYKSTVRKSILPGANNPYENNNNNNSSNNNGASNNGKEDIPEEDEVEEGFMDLDKLINNEDYDSPRGASGANSVPDAVAASPREYPPPRQAMSPDSILDRRRMHKGHSKSDEFNRSAASTINQRNGPEELKNIDFSKFGYYAKNKTAEEIVLDLLSENKMLKERKRKAENDLSLLQLKYNEDLRKIVEYDHIIEKLNDEKSKLREQTNKLKTDRANFEKEKEAMNNTSNVNNTNPNNPSGTMKSPRTRSGSGDKSAKNKEDGQKKVTKKQLLKDLETVTKQLEQVTSEYETTKTQWLQQEKKRVEDEKNKPQTKERVETVDNGSTSPELPTNMSADQERVFYKNKWLSLKERHEQDLRRTKSLEEERNKLKSDLAKLPRAGSSPSTEIAPSLVKAKVFNHPQLEQTPNLSQLLKEKLAINNELRQLKLQLNDINHKISHGTLQASDPQKSEIESAIHTKTARLDEVTKLIDEEDSKVNLNSSNLAHKPTKNTSKIPSVPSEVRISIKTLTLVLVVIVAYVFKTL